MSWTQFRPALPMSMRRTNTPRRIALAPASTHMRNASSASRERRTGSIGRHPKVKSQAPSANSSPRQPRRVTVSGRADTLPRLLFQDPDEAGSAAPGGELEYVVRGKMIGGFALVAYPAEYRNSGVMTFIVSHAGTVFQKDLGPDTAKIAERMSSFNPDKTWQKVSDTAPPKKSQLLGQNGRRRDALF